MILRFSNCQLDLDRHVLSRDGQDVHVEPQVFALLVELARADGAVISKERLVETVWHGLNVSDAAISARINAARAAVGDSGKAQRIIKTVPKLGFQVIVPVHRPQTDGPDRNMPSPRAPQSPRVRYTKSGDGQMIAHACHGTGPPLMRASHWLSHLELDCESAVWQPLLDELSARFTLYRYDQRGTGLSTRDVGNLTLDAFVDDLLAVADANGLDRFPIFAASQAVPVAIRFAARFPDRVSRMVLYGGYAVGRMYREAGAGEIDEATILGLIRAGWGQKDSAFLSAFCALFVPDATRRQLDSFVRVQDASISPENAAILRQAVDRFMVRSDLPKVQVPVLVVHARADAVHPVAQGQMMAAELPNAEFMMLESRNHAPLPQDPAWRKLVDAIVEFSGAAS